MNLELKIFDMKSISFKQNETKSPVVVLIGRRDNVKSFLVVEMSCGQMIEDVKLAIDCAKPVHFYGRTGGEIPSEDGIIKAIENC